MIGLTPTAVGLLREEKVLAWIHKSATDQIRITWRQVDGRELATVSVWTKVADGCVPTRTGFSLSRTALSELLFGMSEAGAAIEGEETTAQVRGR